VLRKEQINRGKAVETHFLGLAARYGEKYDEVIREQTSVE
jgi:hypothetical protein